MALFLYKKGGKWQMDAKIIEEKIYAATGRVVDGKSILEEI